MAWRAVTIGAVACGVVVVGGCVGTTDREEFDEIIQERGGGFTSELPLDAVAAVASDLGVEDIAVRSISITPPSEMVVMEVRDPSVPANLDRYVVRRGEVDEVEPVRLSATDDLDATTFLASEVALDRIEEMVDSALARFDPAGYVTSMSVGGTSGSLTIHMSLESPRATATATFTGAGELVEVTRS